MTKEEIIDIIANNVYSSGKGITVRQGAIFSAIDAYATAQTAELQKEVERVKEESDSFAISFAIWVKHDAQAQAYQDAGVTAYKLLELYKDRPYIDTFNLNQQ